MCVLILAHKVDVNEELRKTVLQNTKCLNENVKMQKGEF